VFALTSRFEGMPNTVAEAMMLGHLVAATALTIELRYGESLGA
jgi:hypothetical protein